MRSSATPRTALRRQRGMSLLEVMIAVWLLGALFLAIASLEAFFLRELRKVEPGTDSAMDLTLCSRALVADARRSSSYRWEGDDRVVLRRARGGAVIWRQEGDLIVREETGRDGERARKRSWRGVDGMRRVQSGPRLFMAWLGTETPSPRIVSAALRVSP